MKKVGCWLKEHKTNLVAVEEDTKKRNKIINWTEKKKREREEFKIHCWEIDLWKRIRSCQEKGTGGGGSNFTGPQPGFRKDRNIKWRGKFGGFENKRSGEDLIKWVIRDFTEFPLLNCFCDSIWVYRVSFIKLFL